jgi:hypothetical protein
MSNCTTVSTRRKKIYQGSDRTLNLVIRDEEGNPIDLTAVTEITAVFKATDGTNVTFTIAGGEVSKTSPQVLGKLSIAMNSTKTALIEAGEQIDFELILDTGAHPAGTRRYVPFLQQIDVVASSI